MLEIYTDGSCLRNPGGAGGWAAVMLRSDETKDGELMKVKTLKGGLTSTTNNIMELAGPLYALKFLLEEYTGEDIDSVKIYSDSQYVVRGMTSWIKNWIKYNWKTSTGKDVKNIEYWKALNDLTRELKELGVSVNWIWVKGHNGNLYNETADKLSR